MEPSEIKELISVKHIKKKNFKRKFKRNQKENKENQTTFLLLFSWSPQYNWEISFIGNKIKLFSMTTHCKKRDIFQPFKHKQSEYYYRFKITHERTKKQGVKTDTFFIKGRRD